MKKIATHTFTRQKALVYVAILGFVIGIINVYFLPINFILSLDLFFWLSAAIISVIVLHEGIHGLVANILGYKPIFGIKFPQIFVTFSEQVPVIKFITIALAPLIFLDLVFAGMFFHGILEEFSYFCLLINTLGATGDIWIFIKLIQYDRSKFIQDTKTGVEVWGN